MTGRTIPVTRTDGSEIASEATSADILAKLDITQTQVVNDLRGEGGKTLTDLHNDLTPLATEATQLNIKAKTDNLDIALSVLRDALRGSGSKTNTDIVTALGQVVLAAGSATIGKVDQGAAGASPWAQNLTQVNGASLSLGQKTGANSLPVVLSSDGPFAVNFGVTTDSAVTDPTATASHMALQKGQLTKLASIDGGIGGASAAAAADTGASTTNGFLRWIRDFWLALKGTKTAANSLSVTGASDGYFVVGGATADGNAPAAGTYSVRVGGQDSSGNKRTLVLKSGGELPVYSPALTITENFNGALTASYQKVVTTTAATKMLRMSAACNAGAYDIEFQVVTAGAAAPSTTGMALLAGDDFPQGIPVGDIYARSASLQKLIVWSA